MISVFITENTSAFAPMPSASVRITVAVKPGLCLNERKLCLASAQNSSQCCRGADRIVSVKGIEDAIELCGDTLVHMKTPKIGDRRATGYEGEGFAIVKHATTDGVKHALRTLIENIQIRYG